MSQGFDSQIGRELSATPWYGSLSLGVDFFIILFTKVEKPGGVLIGKFSEKKAGIDYWRVVLLGVYLLISISFGKTEIPVFLFSGQSNMAGQAPTKGLSLSQKETMDNIRIIVDGNCDGSKKGKWLPLSPGFGNSSSDFGPELIFGKTLTDSMPNQKMAFIKYAVNSTPLGSSSGYYPPSSNNGKGGSKYNNLIDHIEKAMASFHTAFDTSEHTPRWAGFIWMQGESDAKQSSTADNYATNLENLIGDIRAFVETEDLPVIIPLITTAPRWKQAEKIRAAVVALREKLKNVDTLETEGFHLPDNMHYDAEGQIRIGRISAIRWLTMDYRYRDVVSVLLARSIHHLKKNPPYGNKRSTVLFTVSGRRIRTYRNATEFRLPQGSCRSHQCPGLQWWRVFCK